MTAAPWDGVPGVSSGDPREQVVYLIFLALLVAGTALAALALRAPHLDVAAAAVAGAAAGGWVLANAAAEGPTLLVVRPGNGLTAADLAAAPALVLVAVLARRRWDARGRP